MRALGSVFSPELGYHLWVALEEGALVETRIAGEPAPTQDAAAQPLLARLARHMREGADAFADVPVDLARVPPFQRRVLEALRAVPAGRTVRYADLAAEVGSPGASRAVGGAMARNPCPVVVPCHRVLPAEGKVGNYSGEGGWATKMRLLEIERAPGFPRQARLM